MGGGAIHRRRCVMPKYLARASYTAEGAQGLRKDKASGRRAVAAQVLESLGGKLECFYFAFGEDDAVMIYELPDNVVAVRVSMAVNAFARFASKPPPLGRGGEGDDALGAADTGSGAPGQCPATRTCAPS